MQTIEIDKNEWQVFFDKVSGDLEGKTVQIEVDSLETGANIELKKIPLSGLSYDKKDDTFIISTNEIEHIIHSPEQIFVTDGSQGVESLQVCASDGDKHIAIFG